MRSLVEIYDDQMIDQIRDNTFIIQNMTLFGWIRLARKILRSDEADKNLLVLRISEKVNQLGIFSSDFKALVHSDHPKELFEELINE